VRQGSLVAAVLLCLAAGCGDRTGGDPGATDEAQNGVESPQGTGTADAQDNDGGQSGPDTGDDNGDAIGAPKPHKGGGAKGAPIKLPSRVQDSGATLSEEIPAIRRDIVDACGGSVCVRWRIRYRHIDGRTRCLFDHIEPQGEPMVERGSTFTIVAGAADCEDDGSGDDNGDGGSGTGDQPGDPATTPDQPGGESP
jgi:hypothetical protein